jgi:hypothetical protein
MDSVHTPSVAKPVAAGQPSQPWREWFKPGGNKNPVIRHQVMVYEDARNGHAPREDETAVIF